MCPGGQATFRPGQNPDRAYGCNTGEDRWEGGDAVARELLAHEA
jgi:hypothetical protein